MGMNPDEFYHQQKRVQQDHDRSAAKHGTLETLQIEQESADRGSFVADPMDKDNLAGSKPNIITRLVRMITGKKS